MAGRVIYDSLLASRRYNDLWLLGDQIGTLAQAVYLNTYICSDNWGHLPFDLSWVKLQALRGYRGPSDVLFTAMCGLLWAALWEGLYKVDSEFYVHIYNFEIKSVDGFRNRRKGIWPDESGHVPTRSKDDKKIQQSIEKSNDIRKNGKLYVNHCELFVDIFRNFPKRSEKFCTDRTGQDRTGQDIINTNNQSAAAESASGGLIKSLSENSDLRESFIAQLVKKAGGIREAAKMIYRARNAKNPYGYIMAGIREGYIYIPSPEEESCSQAVENWIDTAIGILTVECKRGGGPETISEILSKLLPQEVI